MIRKILDKENIKNKRKKYGYTQKQISEMLHIKLETYQKWELGEIKNPNMLTIIELAKIFNCSYEELYKEQVIEDENNIKNKFNHKVFKSMREKNYTQSTLAEIMGVSTSTIRKWENGDREPSDSNIKKLIKIFNCTKEDLIISNK